MNGASRKLVVFSVALVVRYQTYYKCSIGTCPAPHVGGRFRWGCADGIAYCMALLSWLSP